MTIEINNLTKFRLDKKLCTGVAKKVIKGENIITESLSIAFVSSLEIKKLNKKYRGKNKPTDILSFANENSKLPEASSQLQIVICPEIVKKNAEKFGNTFKKELTKILIHGVLHLAGYDHEKSEKEAKIMEAKEEVYSGKLNSNI